MSCQVRVNRNEPIIKKYKKLIIRVSRQQQQNFHVLWLCLIMISCIQNSSFWPWVTTHAYHCIQWQRFYRLGGYAIFSNLFGIEYTYKKQTFLLFYNILVNNNKKERKLLSPTSIIICMYVLYNLCKKKKKNK